jgi:HK97 family phage prohead protease
MRILKTALSSKGEAAAVARIAAGDVDKTSAWTAGLATASGDWCLDTGGKYPFGKDGKVFRSSLIAIRSRAAQQNDSAIFDAAGRMLDGIDGSKSYSGTKALPMKQQAWAKFDLKAMTETDTHYEMSGVATTPTPDRMEDIVEPMGGEYELPIPFLWQHDSDQPVGEVYDAKPSAKGIPVQFRIPKFSIPGLLKDRLDLAIQSITLKLVRGLSIGFAPIEYSYMEDTGGYRFIKWLWLELSAVTIPANSEASIAVIKSFDRKATPVVRLSAESRAVTTKGGEPARRKMQDWCDTSSESVDEIIAARELMLK